MKHVKYIPFLAVAFVAMFFLTIINVFGVVGQKFFAKMAYLCIGISSLSVKCILKISVFGDRVFMEVRK